MIPQWKDGLYPWQLKLVVLELKKLNVPAFAYCHETVTEARITGRNLVHEIRDCKTWNIICVDPEHLREKAWRQISAFDVFRANIDGAEAVEQRPPVDTERRDVGAGYVLYRAATTVTADPDEPPAPATADKVAHVVAVAIAVRARDDALTAPRAGFCAQRSQLRRGCTGSRSCESPRSEYDKELDPPPHPESMPRQASFLDLTRDSFDSSRSVDLDLLDYN
ncbi:hypothetical protein B0H14DRAFT_2573898 [Mycena olivaceomarginata]|nr:hypothetical protein B0H14DRAFT_2573898 [Mycena olivaceomarginata]